MSDEKNFEEATEVNTPPQSETEAITSACCSPSAQQTCCAPAAKSTCCG